MGKYQQKSRHWYCRINRSTFRFRDKPFIMSNWSPEYNTAYSEEASGTLIGYVTGTVKLVFILFFIFLLLSAMTAMLMGYSRYMTRRPQGPGFFNPPKLQFKQKQAESEPMKSSGQSTVL